MLICHLLSTIVEIIEAYQPFLQIFTYSIYLQQQKLQKLTSLEHQNQTIVCQSTIVEIIEAYQPFNFKYYAKYIYNSRNYRSLLAAGVPLPLASIYNSRNYRSLLAGFTIPRIFYIIYNSRNYRSLLAYEKLDKKLWKSTIVEIIEAYQPLDRQWLDASKSTIVEIIEAYQPTNLNSDFYASTIVEIIEAYQPTSRNITIKNIYNSRNYRSLLAQANNLLMHFIYNSRNYRSLLAVASFGVASTYLQQQKLQKLTSRF